MIVIGIDGGVSGAIAFIDQRGEASVHDMPTVPQDGSVTRRVFGPAFKSLVLANIPKGEPCMAVIEQLAGGGRGPGGESRGNAMTVGSQHETRATLICVLELLGLRQPDTLHTVSPAAWKRLYGVPKASKDNAHKAFSLQTARDLYPALAQAHLTRVKDHNRAEAILIAHWARKVLA